MAQGCSKPILKKRMHLQIYRWNYLRTLGAATAAHKSLNLGSGLPKHHPQRKPDGLACFVYFFTIRYTQIHISQSFVGDLTRRGFCSMKTFVWFEYERRNCKGMRGHFNSCDEMWGNLFSCEERGEEEVEGVVQTRERRGDWGLGTGGLQRAKVQNTNHWLEVGAASARGLNKPSPVAGLPRHKRCL